MGQRLELQAIFEALVGSVNPSASTNVYFQPPETLQMQYPCITYQNYISKTQFANGLPYIYSHRYQAIVIDPDPDSQIPDKVAALPMCLHNRFYVVGNLNHNVFNLYF